MENQVNSKSIILNYGLYLGVLSVIASLIKYATGNLYVIEFYSAIVGIVLLIVFVILGIRKFKSDNNGFLTFGEGAKVGLGVTLIATLIIIAYSVLLATVIEPDFITNTIEAQKVMFADSFGMTEGQIEEATKNSADNFFLSMAGGILIWNFFVGGVTSLIAAAVMKQSEEETY